MSNIIYNTNQTKNKYFYIYKIINLINNKIYIGQRSSKILHELDTKYMGSGKIIKRAINKHGIENFIKEIIEICESKEQLNEREIYWIEFYQSRNPEIGYNLTKGGGGVNGLVCSDETRLKLSLASKGRPVWITGKHHSEETKIKIGLAVKNRKIINPLMNKGKYNPMYGKHLSNEAKEKISIANKNISDETRIKKSLAKKGKKFSEEHKVKLRLSDDKRYKIVKCPYCGKECIIANAKRWHFENCKFKLKN